MNEGKTEQDDPEKDPEMNPGEKQERCTIMTEETVQEFHPP
jgi:hypothetical protein